MEHAHNGTFYVILYIFVCIYYIMKENSLSRWPDDNEDSQRERNNNGSIAIKKRIWTSAAVIPMHPFCILFIRNNILFFVSFFSPFFFIQPSKFRSFRPETLRRQYCLVGRATHRTKNNTTPQVILSCCHIID